MDYEQVGNAVTEMGADEQDFYVAMFVSEVTTL